MLRTWPVFLILLLLGLPSSSSACVCVTLEQKSHFQASQLVFVGQLIERSADGGYVLLVTESFKGTKEGERVTIEGWDYLCGEYPEEDDRRSFLVFAAPTADSGIWARTCSPTRLATHSWAECDIKLLRRRAAWWKFPLSRLRLVRWLGVYRPMACR